MKLALKITIPILVVLIGAFVTYKLTRPKYHETGVELKSLPEDSKLAQKEIANARLALSKLKPKGIYLVINTHSNILSMRTEDSVIFKGNCSTGSGGDLIDSTTGRHWIFDTPRGIFKIKSKVAQPWWRKPDWAFIEENEEIPKDESERLDPEMLGEYALGFGDGYFIHGTIYERLLGVSVTHGCVRLGSDDLKFIYDKTPINTPLYIF
jgi:hypothetical protein